MNSRVWRAWLLVAAALIAAVGWHPRAAAQVPATRTIPQPDYYLALNPYFDGDYRNAIKSLRSASRTAVRSVNGPWVDSVCYHAMLGECFFQMGEQAVALEQFTTAVQLFVGNQGWTSRIEFPVLIEPWQPNLNSPINWGTRSRNTIIGRFKREMPFLQGRLDNSTVAQTGGVIAPPELRPVNVDEILRAAALAIRRRTQILGVVCPHDPLTAQLVAATRVPLAPPNSWASCWNDCLHGLALHAAGRPDEAIAMLERSSIAAQRFDHPLTAIALIEAGKLAYAGGDFRRASVNFYEATFPAAAYGQFDLIAEAFQGGLRTHLAAGGQGSYDVLAPAAIWAQRQSRAMQAWLELSTAENLMAVGNFPAAATTLDQARATAARADLTSGLFGARMNYVAAQAFFMQGNAAAASRAFASALVFQKTSSPRLFQISMADRLAVAGACTDREAERLYDYLLADPSPLDWRHDPLDTFAYLMTPPPEPLLRYYSLVLARRDFSKAVHIADQIRRRRFYSQLGMGGRVLSLRWILEAPENTLSASALQQRKAMRAAFPQLIELSDRILAIRARLDALPLVPEAPDAVAEQKALFTQWTAAGVNLEVLLQGIALSRAPSEFVFPPVLPAESVQEQLANRSIVISFFEAAGVIHGFAISKTGVQAWRVGDSPKIHAAVRELLKRIGHLEKSNELTAAALANDSWKDASRTLTTGLFYGLDKKPWEDCDELMIVPDGSLWYLPFEALLVGTGDDEKFLIQKTRIRYAPFASMAGPMDPRPMNKQELSIAVYSGKIAAADTIESADAAYAQLSDAIKQTYRLTKSTPTPGLAARMSDVLVVLGDLEQRAAGAFGWSPLTSDLARGGGTVNDWLGLPFAAPRQVVMPGFYTTAETGLKRPGDGSEIFLNVCAMLAAGSHNVLLSRWRVGGKSTQDLMREYVQELPHVSAPEAWSRAVQLTMDNELDSAREPRLAKDASDQAIKASHPFFWSGYLLADDGWQPHPAEEVDPAAPLADALPVLPAPPPPATPAPPAPEPAAGQAAAPAGKDAAVKEKEKAPTKKATTPKKVIRGGGLGRDGTP